MRRNCICESQCGSECRSCRATDEMGVRLFNSAISARTWAAKGWLGDWRLDSALDPLPALETSFKLLTRVASCHSCWLVIASQPADQEPFLVPSPAWSVS